MEQEKNWYAIYTKPRWEKKVSELLNRKDIQNYCPLNRVLKQWVDRKKIVLEPLFKSYVFVHVSNSEIRSVKECIGVVSFVNWLNKPAIIRDAEIMAIKDFLDEHINVRVEHVDISIDDRIRILNGPFSAYEGKITAVNNNKVKLYLPSLGYMMVVEVEKSNIQIIEKSMFSSRGISDAKAS